MERVSELHRLPRIVILGAGYGGIVTAVRLQKELNYNEADVTLVHEHDYHTIATRLCLPAGGSFDPKHAKVDILCSRWSFGKEDYGRSNGCMARRRSGVDDVRSAAFGSGLRI